MSKVKLSAGIALIFLLGCLAGGLGMEYYHQQTRWNRPPHRPTPAERVDFICKRLAKDLDLSDRQTDEIRGIVEQGERAVSEIKEGVEPEIIRIHDQVFAAIRPKLDSGQQKKLDQLIQRLKKFSRRSGSSGPPSDK